MLKSSSRALTLVAQQISQQAAPAVTASAVFNQSGQQVQQFRFIGGDKIPEFWGKPSAYTEGTAFLGTPTNHLETLNKRPLSPDVLEIDGKSMHYKFPWGALSSITNRATGVALSVGTVTAAVIALRGDLTGTVQAIAATNGLLLFPFKFAVTYTILYHWLGGIRHVLWDHSKIGNQQGVRAGDVICLFGEVGSGKSVFSRAFIRASARDCTLPVPSPTFLLQNIYDEDVLGSGSVPIHHFDLYRLPPAAGPDEVAMYRLNLDSSFSQACSLIEWPERLMKLMPATYLAVYIQPIINPAPVPGSGHRQVSSTQEAAGNDESDSGDVYADTRPRLISMEPHGGTWHQLLAQLVVDLSTVAGQHGLHVLQAELAQGQTELSSRL
ncbi:hypothetical protein QJQ45_004902 [Haematococcus lacustris]|nr:hypothetical protein QJQ45_004902 [Haematococcus lacustris]